MKLLQKAPPRGAFDYLLDGMHDIAPKPKLPEPPPPERGGGPRVRIEFEIIDKRQAEKPKRRVPLFYKVFWACVLLILISGLAHADEIERVPDWWAKIEAAKQPPVAGPCQSACQAAIRERVLHPQSKADLYNLWLNSREHSEDWSTGIQCDVALVASTGDTIRLCEDGTISKGRNVLH